VGQGYKKACACCGASATQCKNAVVADACPSANYLAYDAAGCLQEHKQALAPRHASIPCGLPTPVTLGISALVAAQVCTGTAPATPSFEQLYIVDYGNGNNQAKMSSYQSNTVTHASADCIYIVARACRILESNLGRDLVYPAIFVTGALGTPVQIYDTYSSVSNMRQQTFWIPATGAGSGTISISGMTNDIGVSHQTYEIAKVCGVDIANPFKQIANTTTAQNIYIQNITASFATAPTNPLIAMVTGRHAYTTPSTLGLYYGTTPDPGGYAAPPTGVLVGTSAYTRPYASCNATAVTAWMPNPLQNFTLTLDRDPFQPDLMQSFIAELNPYPGTLGACTSDLGVECVLNVCNPNNCANGIIDVPGMTTLTVNGGQFTYAAAVGNKWSIELVIDGVVKQTSLLVDATNFASAGTLTMPAFEQVDIASVSPTGCVEHKVQWRIKFDKYVASATNALSLDGYKSNLALEHS
jgi:hypothetical protein